MVMSRVSEEPSLRKGLWTPEEDRRLIAYIKRYGIWNWSEMPKYAGLLRCGKSCRLRWMNYLRPGIKHGNFTQEEDETIIKLHQELGNRWSVIASKLPGRTDNEIKNHWHTRLKKQLIENNQHRVEGPSITKSLQETKTANQQMQNPSELLLADPLLLNNSSTSPQHSTDTISSSTGVSSFADEFYKIQTSEINNYGPVETFDQLNNFWEQPFTIIEDLCVMDGYGATYTYKDTDTDPDPGFMVSTSLWGFEEYYTPLSASNYDADVDVSWSTF